MLPDGWRRSTLGEIARITSGGTPERSEPSYWGGSVPWVTTGEIQFNTITDTAEKITEAGLKNSSAKLFPPGTLLMAMYGQGKTRGQVAKLGVEASTNQACAAILLHEGHDPDFYFQYFAFQYEAIRELGNAGTQQNLSGGILKGVDVSVPPIDEQRRIARVLGAWDAAISTTERLLTKSREQKGALSQTLMAPTSRSPLNLVPLMRKPASEIFKPISVRGNGDLPLLSVMQDVGVVPRDSLDRKVAMPEGSTESYKRVEPGNFVISLRSFEGGLEYSRHRGLVSPAYTVLEPCRPICDDFYRHYFKSVDFIGRLAVAVIGIRDGKQISYDDFAFLKLPAPSLREQQRIADALNSAEATCRIHQRQLERLRLEKRALMADLLTGKRRVRLHETKS